VSDARRVIASEGKAARYRHCERSEAIQCGTRYLDCFVATLLAMTGRCGTQSQDGSALSPVTTGLDPVVHVKAQHKYARSTHDLLPEHGLPGQARQ
jgi:hypothetical protein